MERNVPLASRTSLGIGGEAAYYLDASSRDDIASAALFAARHDLPLHVLGGGTNLLVADHGVEGVVVRLEGAAFSGISFEGGTVTAGAACSLAALVRGCIERGMGGPEVLAGIPGTVGGAVVMNAGGSRGTVSDCIQRVTVFRASTGRVRVLSAGEMCFGYRTSSLGPGDVVLSARFLCRAEKREVLEARFAGIMEDRREKQPLGEKSCGCVFRNPRGRAAAELIDMLGFKGKRCGNVEISRKHANFFVNRGGGTAREVVCLMKEVWAAVRDAFGVCLEPEVRMWGECGWSGKKPASGPGNGGMEGGER